MAFFGVNGARDNRPHGPAQLIRRYCQTGSRRVWRFRSSRHSGRESGMRTS